MATQYTLLAATSILALRFKNVITCTSIVKYFSKYTRFSPCKNRLRTRTVTCLMTIAYVNSLEVQEKLNTSVRTLVISFKMKCRLLLCEDISVGSKTLETISNQTMLRIPDAP